MSEQSPGPIVPQSDKRTQDVVDKWTLREREDGCSDILRDGISYGSLLHDNASFIVGRLNQRDRFMEAAVADATTIASLREQVEWQERELDVINSSHRDIGIRYEAAQEQVERLRDAHFNADDAQCYWQERAEAAESRVSLLKEALRKINTHSSAPIRHASQRLDRIEAICEEALRLLPVSEPKPQGYRSANIGQQVDKGEPGPVNAGNTSSCDCYPWPGKCPYCGGQPTTSSDGIAEGREAATGLPVASEPQGQSRSIDRVDANSKEGAVAANTRQSPAGIKPGPSETISPDVASITHGIGSWLSAAQPVEWQLVPVEPTPDMNIKGGIAISDAKPTAETYVDEAYASYKAMLAAAPSFETHAAPRDGEEK